jgi:hypothetical protein
MYLHVPRPITVDPDIRQLQYFLDLFVCSIHPGMRNSSG